MSETIHGPESVGGRRHWSEEDVCGSLTPLLALVRPDAYGCGVAIPTLAKRVAESTLAAIMGREAAHTGPETSWDQVLEAEPNLAPPDLAFGPLDVPPVSVPELTKLERRWTEGWITEPPPRRRRRR